MDPTERGTAYRPARFLSVYDIRREVERKRREARGELVSGNMGGAWDRLDMVKTRRGDW